MTRCYLCDRETSETATATATLRNAKGDFIAKFVGQICSNCFVTALQEMREEAAEEREGETFVFAEGAE